jgi:hypothetical protein
MRGVLQCMPFTSNWIEAVAECGRIITFGIILCPQSGNVPLRVSRYYGTYPWEKAHRTVPGCTAFSYPHLSLSKRLGLVRNDGSPYSLTTHRPLPSRVLALLCAPPFQYPKVSNLLLWTGTRAWLDY